VSKDLKKILKLRRNHKKSPIKKLKFSFKDKKQQKHFEKPDEESLYCPFCQQIIPLKNKILHDINIDCPHCSRIFLLESLQEKKYFSKPDQTISPDKETKLKETETCFYKPSFIVKMVGLILIVIGMFFLINPNPFNIKISITFIIIGVTLFTIITDKKFVIIPPKTTDKIEKLSFLKDPGFRQKINNFVEKPLDIYDKIAIATVVLVLFLFIITGDADIEIFLILIYLGFLILKEFTKEFTPLHLKGRMNILLIAFLAIFTLIITKRIISIVSI